MEEAGRPASPHLYRRSNVDDYLTEVMHDRIPSAPGAGGGGGGGGGAAAGLLTEAVEVAAAGGGAGGALLGRLGLGEGAGAVDACARGEVSVWYSRVKRE